MIDFQWYAGLAQTAGSTVDALLQLAALSSPEGKALFDEAERRYRQDLEEDRDGPSWSEHLSRAFRKLARQRQVPTEFKFLLASQNNFRRPNRETRLLWEAITGEAEKYESFTVRQMFYRLVSNGTLPKTEAAYNRTCDALTQMRLSGALPWEKVTDGHRTRHIPASWAGMKELLATAQKSFRLDYWASQPLAVELWTEKDALSGILQPIANKYGIPFAATRGFPSLSLRYSAAEMMPKDRPVHLLYVGDFDASGMAIDDSIAYPLFQRNAQVVFHRVALLPEHVKEFKLPTRLGKASDSRQAGFEAAYGADSVEADALPPDVLARLVESAILEYVDVKAWQRAERVEKQEQKTLDAFLNAKGRLRREGRPEA